VSTTTMAHVTLFGRSFVAGETHSHCSKRQPPKGVLPTRAALTEIWGEASLLFCVRLLTPLVLSKYRVLKGGEKELRSLLARPWAININKAFKSLTTCIIHHRSIINMAKIPKAVKATLNLRRPFEFKRLKVLSRRWSGHSSRKRNTTRSRRRRTHSSTCMQTNDAVGPLQQ
jgi:hypothetical protein